MNKSSILPLLLLSALLFVGCEDAKEDFSSSWNNLKDKVSENTEKSQNKVSENTEKSQNTAPNASAPANPGSTKEPTNSNVANNTSTKSDNTPTVSVADAVPFSSLRWSFGGVNGAGAKPSGVKISGLHVGSDSLSFRYDRDLSAWGLSSGQADAVECFFVQKSNGSWVGGKFDWISSSRTTRDFVNIKTGYSGWSLSGVPNPCSCAFVIISRDGKKRSNVLAGRWSR